MRKYMARYREAGFGPEEIPVRSPVCARVEQENPVCRFGGVSIGGRERAKSAGPGCVAWAALRAPLRLTGAVRSISIVCGEG